MSHTCAALAITCIDFRLVKQTAEYMQSLGLGENYDLLSIAGASKEIDNEFVQKQIDISVNLHQIKQLFLIHHEDCGAYGGKEKMGSDSEEKEFHIAEMTKAEDYLKSKYPELQVIKIYAQLNGKFEKI